MNMQQTIAAMYPKAHPSHRWAAEWDGDNVECDGCSVRPYNADASSPCPEDPGHGGEDRTTRTVTGAEAAEQRRGWADAVRQGK